MYLRIHTLVYFQRIAKYTTRYINHAISIRFINWNIVIEIFAKSKKKSGFIRVILQDFSQVQLGKIPTSYLASHVNIRSQVPKIGSISSTFGAQCTTPSPHEVAEVTERYLSSIQQSAFKSNVRTTISPTRERCLLLWTDLLSWSN